MYMLWTCSFNKKTNSFTRKKNKKKKSFSSSLHTIQENVKP